MEDFRRKIIYCDDVKFNLITIKSMLKDRYEVYPVQSADRLFDILRHISPDLIMLDVNMPDTDGFETLQTLKNNRTLSDIPVIFLTSQIGKDSVFKGLNLGAAGYVKKPVSAESLIEQIESVFTLEKQRDYSSELLLDGEDDGRPRILAVDDVFVMLRAIHSALCDQYKVYTLSNPTELEDILRKIKPDLFLLDCNMPVLSGFDLVPIIRGYPEHKETPIIFVTADSTFDNIKSAIDQGVNDYIVKPISTNVLREKVSKHLKRF